MTQSKSSDKRAAEPSLVPTPRLRAEGWQDVLRDGTRVRIRPVHSSDVELERRFIEALSPISRRYRFLETIRSPSESLLRQLTQLNPSTDAAYMAVTEDGSQEREIGVARFSAETDDGDCEFAVTVADEWQNKGLGTLLMHRLIDDARARGIREMHSTDAADNDLMRRFARHLHLRHEQDPDDAKQVIYHVDLGTPAPVVAQAVRLAEGSEGMP